MKIKLSDAYTLVYCISNQRHFKEDCALGLYSDLESKLRNCHYSYLNWLVE